MLIAKKQQRLETVHLGALAKIVVCLVVNIFQAAPREESGAKTLNCRRKNVRGGGEQKMWNISDDVSACHTASH